MDSRGYRIWMKKEEHEVAVGRQKENETEGLPRSLRGLAESPRVSGQSHTDTLSWLACSWSFCLPTLPF